MNPRRDSWGWALLATLPALLLLGWQVQAVWPFFSDDAFISLRYSERLLAGEGLTWTDGERVEGYSNLLWVLLCAGLGGTGLDLVVAARLLGAVATVIGLFALARALRPHDARSAALAALPPLLAASTQVALAWTCSGLEGPLVFGLLALGFGALVRTLASEPDVAQWPRAALLRASVPFALACWTRPDAPLWVATTAVGLAVAANGGLAARLRCVVAFAVLPFAAFLAQLLFRLAYHGDVVPNTAHVKADFDPAAFTAGLRYVTDALLAHQGITAVAIVSVIAMAIRASTRHFALLLALPTLTWLLYLVTIGGDHFAGRRLLHGAIVPMVLLAGVLLRSLSIPITAIAGAALLLLATIWNATTARTDPQTAELRGEIWEWRGKVAGQALQRAFGEQRPLLAVDAAGAVPFYSRLPALDLMGLCDRTIAQTPMPTWLQTMRPEIPRPPGHLKGNGRYVMDRAPDLLLFSNPPGLPLAVFVSACEFEDDPRFLNNYRGVLVDLGRQTILPGVDEELVMPLWVHRHGRVGVRSDGDTITVPAFLFGAHAMTGPIQRRHQPPTGDAAVEAAIGARMSALLQWFTTRHAVAVADASGHLQLELRGPGEFQCTVDLPAGEWRALVEPDRAAVDVLPTTLSVAQRGPVQLSVQVRQEGVSPQRVDRVLLRRIR